jgi:nitroimidazol reductase NimA-like FMN-containing flavoprotein (pyridoxamine 5'-phosphate oxidase superfamily)
VIVGNKEEIRNRVFSFLREHDLAVIATSSKDGRPEAATVGYLVDPDLNFLFLTRRESRKVGNLNENPKVALVIGTSKGVNTVQVEGEAKIFYDSDKGFAENVTKITNIEPVYYGPLLKMGGTEFAIIKVIPTWLRWLDVNELTGKEEFFQLIP